MNDPVTYSDRGDGPLSYGERTESIRYRLDLFFIMISFPVLKCRVYQA